MPLPAYIRARGVLEACLQNGPRGTRIADLSEAGGYRLKFPRSPLCEAMIVNTGGGMAGGDRLDLSLSLQAHATAVCSTQSAEKIYRTDQGRAEIHATIRLEQGARLDWLPQETILFNGAQLHRRLHVDMAADARFLACESVVFGRQAMGETLSEGHLSDHWDIRRDGKLVFAERLRIEGDLQALLGRKAIGADARAITSLLYVAPDAENLLDPVRGMLSDQDTATAEWGASAWNGLLSIRGLGSDPSVLRRQIAQFLARFRQAPLPRVWQC